LTLEKEPKLERKQQFSAPILMDGPLPDSHCLVCHLVVVQWFIQTYPPTSPLWVFQRE